MRKSDGIGVDHEKKTDRVRVHHEKVRWGESSNDKERSGEGLP